MCVGVDRPDDRPRRHNRRQRQNPRPVHGENHSTSPRFWGALTVVDNDDVTLISDEGRHIEHR